LYVRNDGNVGIGTSSINGSDGSPSKLAVALADTGTGRAFTGMAPNLSAGNSVYLGFGVEASTKNSAWLSFTNEGAGNDSNYFSAGLYGVNDILTINGAGNVGIGTTTPEEELEVNGSVIAKEGFAAKLWDVAGGHYETAIAGVEYYSPDQHGGYFGTVYRKYFGIPDGAGDGADVYIDIGVTPVYPLDISGFLYRFNETRVYMLSSGSGHDVDDFGNNVSIDGSTIRIDPNVRFDIQGGYGWIDYTR
jgi:hypothetical protein